MLLIMKKSLLWLIVILVIPLISSATDSYVNWNSIEQLKTEKNEYVGNKIIFTGLDGRAGYITENFSSPEDIGTVENMMIVDGILTKALTKESLDYFLDANCLRLKTINLTQAKNLDKNRWIYYENNFFQVLLNKSCLAKPLDKQKLNYYQTGSYTTNVFIAPTEFLVEIIGDIDPLDPTIPDIKPIITLETSSPSNLSQIKLKYLYRGNIKEEYLVSKGGLFIFEGKISPNERYDFFYPFSNKKYEIFEIFPNVIDNLEIPISLPEDSNFIGSAMFSKDTIQITLKQNLGLKIIILFLLGAIIFSFYQFDRQIKRMDKLSLKIDSLIKNRWLLVLIGMIGAYSQFSYRNLINIFSLLMVIIICVTIMRILLRKRNFK